MAPKPASAKAPKKPTASAKSAKDTSKAEPVEKSDENETKFAPTNKEEALAQISFDGLPNCPIEQITDMFKDKYEVLVKVFAHYCKFSDCVTVEKATRLRLGMPEQACAAARARTCGCVRRGGLCSPAYAHRPLSIHHVQPPPIHAFCTHHSHHPVLPSSHDPLRRFPPLRSS